MTTGRRQPGTSHPSADAGGRDFVRVLGHRDVLAVAFGAMIGFGWVVATGTWVSQAGSLGAVVAFAIGGVLVLLVGLTYAELVSAMPKAGGEHNYAMRGLGVRPAFVTSWAIALGYISVAAFEAVALPTTIDYLVPGLDTGYLWTVAGYEVHAAWAAIGVAGAVVITALNYVGIKPTSIFQAIAVMFLLGVGVLVVIGIFVGGEAANFTPLFSSDAAAVGVLTVVLATPFMFVGFDVIPQSAEEINIPYRQIGKLLVVSVIMAAAWYILMILGVGAGLTSSELADSDLATAEAMGNLFGSQVFANILVLGGVAGIITSWNGFMIGASRILYALAESRMVPSWLGKVHPRFRTPSNAILLVGGLSVIAPFFGESALNWLVNAGGLNIVVTYLLTSLSFLALRRKEPEMERPFRVSGGRIVGVLAVLLTVGIAIQYLPGMPAGLVWPYEWVIVAAWWLVGLVFLVRLSPQEIRRAEDQRQAT